MTNQPPKRSLIIPVAVFVIGATLMFGNLIKDMKAQKAAETPPPALVDKESDTNLMQFWIRAKINFPVPQGMKFTIQELKEKKALHLAGVDKSRNSEFHIFWHEGLMASKDMAYFLHAAEQKIFADPHIFDKIGKSVELPEKTKLKSLAIWRMQSKIDSYVMAYSLRIDKSSDYFIVYKVPKDLQKKTEENLIALFHEAIAE